MKRNILLKTCMGLAIMAGVSSCHGYLDSLPLDKYSPEAVWSTPSSVQAFVNGTYYNIKNSLVSFDDWSDNYAINAQVYDNYIKDQANEDRDFGWNRFGDIRRCNLIIENVNKADFQDVYKPELLGQAYFLRAIINFDQARKFGRLILVDKVLTPEDDLDLARTSTIKETYDAILADFDLAIENLPVDADQGRITKGAALAWKAEAALQGAAYLENASDKPGYYQQAKKASEDLFALGKYELEPDFAATFNTDQINKTNKEIILGVYRLGENTTFDGTFMQFFVPNINHDKMIDGVWENWPVNENFEGWLERTPSHDLAECYEVIDKDGKAKRWDEASYYTEDFAQGKKWVDEAMFTNRDKRFYATIAQDSSKYFKEIIGTRKMGNVHYASNREQPRHVTKTGYVMRKGVYEANWLFCNIKTNYHWVVGRLGRSYLNYAEALLNLGETAKAIEYINKNRVVHGGLPELSTGLSSADAWKYYKNERRVELVNENDRYWSLLRWGMAEGNDNIPELNRNPKALSIEPDGKTFTILDDTPIVQNDRVWSKRRYLLPIPRSQRNENPNLQNDQNPGW